MPTARDAWRGTYPTSSPPPALPNTGLSALQSRPRQQRGSGRNATRAPAAWNRRRLGPAQGMAPDARSGATLLKLVFHEGTDMSQAMAEVVGYLNRARA